MKSIIVRTETRFGGKSICSVQYISFPSDQVINVIDEVNKNRQGIINTAFNDIFHQDCGGVFSGFDVFKRYFPNIPFEFDDAKNTATIISQKGIVIKIIVTV